jgi:hypothetical protein
MLQLDCNVSGDGQTITLNLPGKNGRLCEVVLSFDEASSLGMTLPALLSAALRLRYSNDTLRHVYPLRKFAVEGATDCRHLMLALAADEGFEIHFAMTADTAQLLSRNLAGRATSLSKVKSPLIN